MFFVGLFALSAVYNQSNRVAAQKRLENATYEAEYGEPPPGARKPAKAEEAKPAEPFSAEKFEQELKEREARDPGAGGEGADGEGRRVPPEERSRKTIPPSTRRRTRYR